MYQSVIKSASAALGAIAIVGLTACGGTGPAPAPAENPNIAAAKQWVTAGAAGKTEAMAAVQELMAEDGLLYRSRYVGFGFTWDPADEEGRMIVGTVTPESPVDGLLQSGDQFLSVRGVEVNEANMGKLDFRGKPGEVVDAVILRDGESMDISVARGIIDTPISKAQMLAWMDTGDADTWGPEKWELHEAIGQGNVANIVGCDNIMVIFANCIEIRDTDFACHTPTFCVCQIAYFSCRIFELKIVR